MREDRIAALYWNTVAFGSVERCSHQIINGKGPSAAKRRTSPTDISPTQLGLSPPWHCNPRSLLLISIRVSAWQRQRSSGSKLVIFDAICRLYSRGSGRKRTLWGRFRGSTCRAFLRRASAAKNFRLSAVLEYRHRCGIEIDTLINALSETESHHFRCKITVSC